MRKRSKKEDGSVLLAALLTIVVLSLLGWAFIYTTITLGTQAEKTRLSKQAYYNADAGIERATNALWIDFVDIGMVPNKMGNFETIVDNAAVSPLPYKEELVDGANPKYRVTVAVVEDTSLTNSRQVTVEITSTGFAYLNVAQNEFVTRTIISQVRYFLRGSELLDFAYFANNFAWHTGGIRNGGSMGTNGWMKVDGPYIAGGDRYDDCVGSSYDLIGRIDDGGLYAPKGYQKASYKNYTDIKPATAQQHDEGGNFGTDAFEGLEMPSLAASDFYESYVKDMETEALGDGEKYGMYYWIASGTTLYDSGGNVIGTVPNDGSGGSYMKISDAVYGDDPTGTLNSTTGYYYQNGKWIKGEKENIVLSSTAAKPLKIYGTVVVEENVVLGDNVIDGTGAIFAGYNIYVAGKVEYKDKPTNSSGGASSTLEGYRGFTNDNDGDPDDPSSLAGAEANQEDWLNDNKPQSADVPGGKDLLGLFANESIPIGNMSTSGDRDNLASQLTQGTGTLTIWNGTKYVSETSHDLNESDEAYLGSDQVPNTRISSAKSGGEYVDKEYDQEKNGKWDVKFYTSANPPPPGATNPSTGNPLGTWDGDIKDLHSTYASYSSWPPEVKDAVIPGSGEDLDGDGVYDDRIDIYDSATFSQADASAVRGGSKTWAQALTFDASKWASNGGPIKLDDNTTVTLDVSNSKTNTLGEVSNDVKRLDALTYTNHVWGGYLKGPVNGTLLTRIESTRVDGTESCPINHDDRIAGGGMSITELDFITPLTEAMSVTSWRE